MPLPMPQRVPHRHIAKFHWSLKSCYLGYAAGELIRPVAAHLLTSWKDFQLRDCQLVPLTLDFGGDFCVGRVVVKCSGVIYKIPYLADMRPGGFLENINMEQKGIFKSLQQNLF